MQPGASVSYTACSSLRLPLALSPRGCCGQLPFFVTAALASIQRQPSWRVQPSCVLSRSLLWVTLPYLSSPFPSLFSSWRVALQLWVPPCAFPPRATLRRAPGVPLRPSGATPGWASRLSTGACCIPRGFWLMPRIFGSWVMLCVIPVVLWSFLFLLFGIGGRCGSVMVCGLIAIRLLVIFCVPLLACLSFSWICGSNCLLRGGRLWCRALPLRLLICAGRRCGSVWMAGCGSLLDLMVSRMWPVPCPF